MNQADMQSWKVCGDSPSAYEQYLVSGIFKPWAEKLVELADPVPGSKILDMACGTGIVGRIPSRYV